MATIQFNAFSQVSAQGKLELTPNANIFTCQINPEYEGDDLVPAQAVKLIGSTSGVPVVDVVGEGDKVFGFVCLDHKYNNFKAGKLCRIASDYATMTMVSDGAITRGDYVTISDGVKVETTEDSSLSIGIAMDNSFDGALLRVLIKCLGSQTAVTPPTPAAGGVVANTNPITFQATLNAESATETFEAGMGLVLVSSEDGITVDVATDTVNGFLVAQDTYTKGGTVTVATTGSIVYLTAKETITAGNFVSWDADSNKMVVEEAASQGVALQSCDADDLFACLLTI